MERSTLVDTNEVVIIDFGIIANATRPLETCKEFLQLSDELKEAFSRRKVVFLINHGISEDEMKDIFSSMDKFFSLSEDIKRKYKFHGMTDLHGYIGLNEEQFYKRDKYEIRESFNVIGKDRKLPVEEIPEFSQYVEDITKKFLGITHLLLQLFAIGMGVNSDFLLNCHKGIWDHQLNTSDLRILYYPAVEEEQHSGIIRCGEHKDYGTFTLLMQDSEGGLEVCGENGEWRRVGHIPGAIFLNTASLLEVWTCEEYKATLHRVVVPEEKNIRNRSRTSMAFFVQPDSATIIKPLHPSPGTEVEEFTAKEYIENKVYVSDPLKRK